jgi:hypothetical protein
MFAKKITSKFFFSIRRLSQDEKMLFQGNAIGLLIKLVYGILWQEDVVKFDFFKEPTHIQVIFCYKLINLA